MSLSNKRVAVLAENNYQDLELWYPVLRLREAGAAVTVAGPKAGETYRSKNGYPVTAEVAADALRAADYDAVVIPGGYAPDLMRRSRPMVDFVREMDAAGKVVAAICHAGWMLCSAGILKGRTATGFWSIADDMKNAGAEFVDREVVVDRNLVTSRVPDDLPAFCREIIRALETPSRLRAAGA